MAESQGATETSEDFPDWRRNMLTGFFGASLANVGFSASYPYLPLVVKEMGFVENLETWVGLFVGLFFTVSLLMTPLWGVIADFFGKKTMVLRAGFGMGLGFCLIALGTSTWSFLAPFVLVAICNGYIPASNALIATNTPARRIGTALSTVQMGAQLGNLIGPVLGAFMATVFSRYRQLFWLSGISMLAAGVLAMFRLRETRQAAAGPFRLHLIQDAKRLARVPNLMVLFLLNLIFTATVYGTTPVASVLTLQLLAGGESPWGLSVEMWVGIVAVSIYLSAFLVLPFWGRLLDRYDPPRMLALIVFGTLLASLPLPFVRTPWQLALARFGFGLFAAGLQPAVMRMIKLSAPAGMEGRAMYFGAMFQMMGNGMTPLIAGLVGPFFGLRVFFWLVTLLLLTGFLLLLRGIARHPGLDYGQGR